MYRFLLFGPFRRRQNLQGWGWFYVQKERFFGKRRSCD
jgi:hypothetical protein